MALSINQLVEEHPDGIEASEQVLTDLDACFEHGFARLGNDHLDTLESLAATFGATPLGERLSQAVEAVGRSEFRADVFEALAAARTAVQGARHDALAAQVCETFGWQQPQPERGEPGEASAEVANWLESTREWLVELALTGFAALDEDTVVPFDATLQKLQERPEATRVAALLTGLRSEMLAHTPTSAIQTVPAARWADLWSRAMLHTFALPPAQNPEPVSGTLRVLGVDLRHHDHVVSATTYGLLDTGGDARFVRTTLTAYKVDIVVDDELWRVFPDYASTLFEAISKGKELELDGMPILPTGDLLWNDDAELGESFNMLDEAAAHFAPDADQTVIMPAHPALDRHPVQLAVPVYLDDYDIENAEDGSPRIVFEDGPGLAMDLERISPYSELEIDHVLGSKKMFGLLRFDAGRWSFQPLVETKRSKLYYTGSSADTGGRASTVGTLRERAGKLLRKKA